MGGGLCMVGGKSARCLLVMEWVRGMMLLTVASWG